MHPTVRLSRTNETGPMDEDIRLLIDLHSDGERQGPGGADETRRAIDLSGLRGRRGLRIADVGCGTGASARVLAAELDAQITAIDFAQVFLDVLSRRIAEENLADRIMPLNASMDALPLEPGSLDAIWSEGAIYNIGFERGVRDWRRFLKPGGVLAVSDLTWLTHERPADLEAHWSAAYPEVATASEKMAVLEKAGYMPVGYFPLPVPCWLDAYYIPLEARFDAFLARHARSEAAQAIVEEERREIALYRQYTDYVSYGFYVAKRLKD